MQMKTTQMYGSIPLTGISMGSVLATYVTQIWLMMAHTWWLSGMGQLKVVVLII